MTRQRPPRPRTTQGKRTASRLHCTAASRLKAGPISMGGLDPPSFVRTPAIHAKPLLPQHGWRTMMDDLARRTGKGEPLGCDLPKIICCRGACSVLHPWASSCALHVRCGVACRQLRGRVQVCTRAWLRLARCTRRAVCACIVIPLVVCSHVSVGKRDSRGG